MHIVGLRGSQAVIAWGYHPAVTLGPWSFDNHTDAGGTVTAQVRTVDAFRVSQQPLTFEVPRPTTTWKWPVVSLQIADGTATVVLGPCEGAGV